MELVIDYSTHAIAQALKKLYEPQKLGQHPLAQTRLVSNRLKMSRSLDTPEHRGLVLATLIEQIITDNFENSDTGVLDWKLLYDRVIEGKPFQAIASELKISDRSLSRYHSRACATLAKALMELEAKACETEQRGHEMDTSFKGASLAPRK